MSQTTILAEISK